MDLSNTILHDSHTRDRAATSRWRTIEQETIQGGRIQWQNARGKRRGQQRACGAGLRKSFRR